MNIAALKAYGFKPIDPVVQDPIKAPDATQTEKPRGTSPNSFAEMLGNAIKEADGQQQVADDKVQSMLVGDGKVTTHDAMIALEKADISFQLLNSIRTKIVRAYEDVMRMQV